MSISSIVPLADCDNCSAAFGALTRDFFPSRAAINMCLNFEEARLFDTLYTIILFLQDSICGSFLSLSFSIDAHAVNLNSINTFLSLLPQMDYYPLLQQQTHATILKGGVQRLPVIITHCNARKICRARIITQVSMRQGKVSFFYVARYSRRQLPAPGEPYYQLCTTHDRSRFKIRTDGRKRVCGAVTFTTETRLFFFIFLLFPLDLTTGVHTRFPRSFYFFLIGLHTGCAFIRL